MSGHAPSWRSLGSPVNSRTREALRGGAVSLVSSESLPWADAPTLAELHRAVQAVAEQVPCREVPDLWLDFEDEHASARAKEACFDCSIRRLCRDYALAHDERWGVWGGLTKVDRERLWEAARRGELWRDFPADFLDLEVQMRSNNEKRTPKRKRCARCGRTRKAVAFHWRNRERGWLASWCRDCQADYRAEYTRRKAEQ